MVSVRSCESRVCRGFLGSSALQASISSPWLSSFPQLLFARYVPLSGLRKTTFSMPFPTFSSREKRDRRSWKKKKKKLFFLLSILKLKNTMVISREFQYKMINLNISYRKANKGRHVLKLNILFVIKQTQSNKI